MSTATPPSFDPTATITVSTGSATYPVHIGAGLLPEVGPHLDTLLNGDLSANRLRAFVVTSPEVEAHWAEPLLRGFRHRPVILRLPAGEAAKRLATVERLAEELAGLGADRGSLLLALGGGVTGDLTGFLAAIYMRGIRYVQVPTTLLAQVDSALGGKTGANLLAGKNLIGAFHHPLAVYADVATLETLPSRELRAGLQEAIKSALIRDADLFGYLERNTASVLSGARASLEHVVARCAGIKAEVVAADEREGGLRMILNLGHTLGHALEAATGYTTLLHGEAVAWGMLAALGLGARRGLLTPEQLRRADHLIRAYGPLQSFRATAGELVALTGKDKKNRGGTRSFVLPVGIGDARVVHDVTEAELLDAAAAICHEAEVLAR